MHAFLMHSHYPSAFSEPTGPGKEIRLKTASMLSIKTSISSPSAYHYVRVISSTVSVFASVLQENMTQMADQSLLNKSPHECHLWQIIIPTWTE